MSNLFVGVSGIINLIIFIIPFLFHVIAYGGNAERAVYAFAKVIPLAIILSSEDFISYAVRKIKLFMSK